MGHMDQSWVKVEPNLGQIRSKLAQNTNWTRVPILIVETTDYGRAESKKPPVHGRKLNPNPKFLGTAEAYFVCHIGPIFQIAFVYAFIGCP